MPTFKSLIPNLWVADMDRSVAFYTQLLDFTRVMSVPDTAPFVWVRLSRDGILIDLNNPAVAVKDYPGLAGRPLGATGCLFIDVEGVRALYDALSRQAKLAMPLVEQPYGMTEFAIEDPDGYVLTFAEMTKK